MYKNTVAVMIMTAALLPCASPGAAEAKNCQLKRYASLELSEPVEAQLSGEGIEIINARISLIDPVPNSSCYVSSRASAATYEGCYGIHPLALGRNVIDKLHFYIATKEKVLYFTRADAAE
jgi:hypothetical protein